MPSVRVLIYYGTLPNVTFSETKRWLPIGLSHVDLESNRERKKNQLALSPSYLGFLLREPCKASLPAHLISCNKNRILCDRDAMSTQLHMQSIPKDAECPRTPNQHPSIRNLEAAALEVNYKFDLHTLGLL